jgi:hypothetical protein
VPVLVEKLRLKGLMVVLILLDDMDAGKACGVLGITLALWWDWWFTCPLWEVVVSHCLCMLYSFPGDACDNKCI